MDGSDILTRKKERVQLTDFKYYQIQHEYLYDSDNNIKFLCDL